MSTMKRLPVHPDPPAWPAKRINEALDPPPAEPPPLKGTPPTFDDVIAEDRKYDPLLGDPEE